MDPVAGKLPYPEDVAAGRRAVFAKSGLTPASSAGDTARRVADSLVKDRLLLALDLWLLSERDPGVRAVLKTADPDPYRDELRDAVLARDSDRVADLAGRADALAQPARFATALGRNSGVSAARRRAILEAGRRAWPGDLNLLLVLGNSSPDDRRDGVGERVRWLQAAVAAHPRSPAARLFLGSALLDRGDLDGAVAECRAAARLDPASATIRGLLGAALRRRGKLDESVAECRDAVRLDPANPDNHFLLGLALRDRGDLADALQALREADRLAPALAPYAAAVRQIERWRELVPRLAVVAAGPAEPRRPLEGLEFVYLAQVCRQPCQRKYVLATRLYSGAFGGKFASAKFLAEENQYDAACCAVLAAAGADAEWAAAGVEEWGLLTDQAHHWLRAEYAALAAKSADPKAWPGVADALAGWKRTPDLASVRDPTWLAAMPPADRKRWADFWATVDAGLAWVGRPAPE